MFNVYKDFYTAKAYKLLNKYEENQMHEKADFISALIDFQTFFSPKSILDTELLLDKYYRPEIIVSVLNDLNYNITTLRKKSDMSLFGITIRYKSLISFTYH